MNHCTERSIASLPSLSTGIWKRFTTRTIRVSRGSCQLEAFHEDTGGMSSQHVSFVRLSRLIEDNSFSNCLSWGKSFRLRASHIIILAFTPLGCRISFWRVGIVCWGSFPSGWSLTKMAKTSKSRGLKATILLFHFANCSQAFKCFFIFIFGFVCLFFASACHRWWQLISQTHCRVPKSIFFC